MSWIHDTTTELLNRADEAKANRAFPFFREFENIGSRVKVGDGSYINFTSNDYLGLSQDKRLIKVACDATQKYGTGLGSARLQATTTEHHELENRLARWLGAEAGAVFTTGYSGVVASIAPFLDDDVTIILDRLNHACIMDGMLVGLGEHPDMEVRLFKHNNMKSLEKVLKSSQNEKKMIVVEGLYSVDGDYGKLDQIVELAKKYNAVTIVDDAHGVGSLGPTGRGVAEKFGVLRDVDILIGTFSKSFGGVGGFCVGDQALIDFIKLSARQFMFTASLPVSQVVAATEALNIIESEPEHRQKLVENATFFREGLVDLGFDLGDSETHITPIMVRDELKTLTFGAYLFHGGDTIMMPFIAPGVPPGTERLRCNVTASHSKAEMGYCLEALAKIGHMLEVIPANTRAKASNLERGMWLAEHKLQGLRQGGFKFLSSELKAARERLATWQRGY